MEARNYSGLEIAVVGMAVRFPEADDIRQFWDNLKEGRNCIREFSDEELLKAGEGEAAIKDPRYVKSGAYLKRRGDFDSAFFEYRPEEAELMDPQMRIFHECCWEALEDSGYADTRLLKYKTGLFAGASSRMLWPVHAALKNMRENLADNISTQYLSDISFLSSLIAYRLHLAGPVMFLQTACSSSLAAIHQACNSLLMGECTLALAGGVTLNNFSGRGYIYQEGQIQSSDGKCRPFDHKASGTVFGEGAGVVVLKRLKDAIKDRDNIYAIVKGSAINNDGGDKVGYTAPSVGGQVEVIAKALKHAKVGADTIGYVETHGTGTILGDPIEIEALSQAFRLSGQSAPGACAIGSVKSNIGHLDVAAGIAGFVKAVLAVKNRAIPASLHYEKPNPNIRLEDSPFYVNTALRTWTSDKPLRAGVSSLGIGGTNVHVIVEEAPVRPVPVGGKPVGSEALGREALGREALESEPYHLLKISGKTPGALKRNAANLKRFLEQEPGHELADIAYTLNVCRPSFPYRKAVVCVSKEDAAGGLTIDEPTGSAGGSKIAFMFPGQGAQYAGMCADLLESQPVFKEAAERCFDIVRSQSGKDIRAVLYSGNPERINDTEFTQPALFIIEYALARLLMNLGIQPDVLIGHSVGEYVAACLSGVFSLEEALRLVVKRGELMQQMERGSMLSISIGEEPLKRYLEGHPGVALAAVNSPAACVVAGRDADIFLFGEEMAREDIPTKRLHTSHAFHSSMMDAMLTEFEEAVKGITINPPSIPFISNITGKIAVYETISFPAYWVRQLRHTVRFAAGVQDIMKDPHVVFVEVGPGRALSAFAGAGGGKGAGHKVVTLLPSREESNCVKSVLQGVGKLWLNGVEPDWQQLYAGEERYKVGLPGYSFDRLSYTAEVDEQRMIAEWAPRGGRGRNEPGDWFYAPTWQLATGMTAVDEPEKRNCTLVFSDSCGIGDAIVPLFRDRNEKVVTIVAGAAFEEKAPDTFILPAADEKAYRQLFERLKSAGLLPDRMVHCWGITGETDDNVGSALSGERMDLEFYSLIQVIKAAHSHTAGLKEVTVITNGLHPVIHRESPGSPLKAMSASLLKVIGQEYPAITTGHIDISLPENTGATYIENLFREIIRPQAGKIVSLRSCRQWNQVYERVPVDNKNSPAVFKDGGVYLVTGGLGKLGYTLAKYIGKNYKAKLVLVGRDPSPSPEKILSIGKDGAEVLYLDCDIADKERFSRVVELAEERFGPLTGVIHASGIVTGRSIGAIDELEKADFAVQFRSKIYGTLVLQEVLKDKQLDFCLVTASLASIVGGLGFGAYAAANAFMDSFVRTGRDNGGLQHWLSLDLDGIDFDDRGSEYISHRELPDVISRALSMKGLPQVIVSTRELQSRLDEWVMKKGMSGLRGNEGGEEESTEENRDWEGLPEEEIKLIKIWRNFFGRTDIGAGDDFFEIGGDSLKAVTLIARINKAFNAGLSLTTFFRNSTIRALSDHLAGINGGTSLPAGDVSIPKAGEKDYYPLSFSQRRLYFLYKLDRISLAYNVPQTVILRGTIDRRRLSQAFRELIGRHASLRTSFHEIDGQPVQRVNNHVSFEIEETGLKGETGVIDESGLKGRDIESLIKDFIRPFDLEAAPLLRAGLLQVNGNEHLLMVDMHHIITDGVSQAILIKDFMSLYNGDTLPALPLQYTDYAEWQHGQEQRERLSVQREFWRQEFAEEAPSLDLPTDFQRPQTKSYTGENRSFSLGREETRQVKAVSEKAGATLFMTMLSIFNVLLYKLSNQKDITVGTGVSARNHADLEGIIGMFVNTLPLRNYPRGEISFAEFLSGVKERSLACLDNQDHPYEELIKDLQLSGDTSRNPLFDVMFAFQNFEQEELVIPGLKLTPYDTEQHKSKFDIELTVIESDDQLQLTFEYATELFEGETIERFIRYFHRIVRQVTADKDILLSAIDILPEEEREELLYRHTDTALDYDRGKTIITLFEEQVRMHSDEDAVVYKGLRMTYGELNERSNRLARHLQASGVERGSIVGLMVERSLEMVVGILGVLKAGAGYLPVDAALPDQRVAYLLEQSHATMLLTEGAYLERCAAYLPVKDIHSPELYRESGENLETGIDAADLAYCIFTSGSTGQPKGVLMGHGSVVNLVKGLEARVYCHITGERVRVGLLASYAFDASVQQLFGALLLGHTLYISEDEDRKDGARLIEFYNRNEIVQSDGTPTHLRLLVNALGEGREVKTLRSWILAGEVLPKDLVKAFYGKGNHERVRMYNFYGPTETCVDSTGYAIDREQLDKYGNIPIGKPLPNERVYVADEYGRLVPVGVAGELCIAGAGLAQRYTGDRALTLERFVEGWIEGEERVYRTGDLARWLPDGNLEYIGRADQQVKLRGYRIELAEIERQLLQHAAVQDGVVVVREREGEKYLVGYYVSAKEIGTDALRSHLAERLPEYMLPALFVRIDSLPVTSSGKVDRKRLPDPLWGGGTNYVAPRTKEEKLLCGIWSKVLGIDNIGIADNFFSVGGDSIKSIQVCARMRSEGYELFVKDILSYPTIEALSVRLKRSKRMAEQSIVTGDIPLTGIQRSFFESTRMVKSHYNQSVLLTFPERITGEAVEKIFTALQSHHDALRMVFRKSDNGIVQSNRGTDHPLSLAVIDLGNEADPKEKLLAHCNELQAGVDLENGPLVRLGLFDLQDGSRLLIVIHHLVIDGVSWRILFEDIETLYSQVRRGEALKLPLKTDSFKLWSEKLQEYETSNRYQEAASYWSSVLMAEEQVFPVGGKGDNGPQTTAVSGFHLNKEFTGKLLGEAHTAFNTRINDILLAAFLLSVHKQYGAKALQVDLEGHGREQITEGIDISRTIGWFTSVYPVILKHPEKGLSGLIKSVKESLRRIPNNGIDYLLWKGAGLHSGDRSPVIFNYLGQFDSDTRARAFRIAEEPTGDVVSPADSKEYAWDISGMIASEQLEMTITYSIEQYSQASMDALMASYEESLKVLIDHCTGLGRTESTPTDFSYKGLTISQLEALQNKIAKVTVK